MQILDCNAVMFGTPDDTIERIVARRVVFSSVPVISPCVHVVVKSGMTRGNPEGMSFLGGQYAQQDATATKAIKSRDYY